MTICCLVVLCSVVLHGLSPLVLIREEKGAVAVVPVASAAVPTGGLPDPEYLTLDEVDRLQQRGEAVLIADSRTQRTWEDSDEQIPGAARLHPDYPVRDAEQAGIGKGTVLAVLCA